MNAFQLGYHISHEQFSPGELLELVQMAEATGFQFALSSDHFHPWSTEQGQSGNAWTWLGAALAKTSFSMGVVNCPYQRYHPTIIAQSAATLLDMFPGRFWMCLGSGQLLNEGITGKQWPSKATRNQALTESIQVMRALWEGGEVNFTGACFDVQEATLYTTPPNPPEIAGAAITAETAKFLYAWTDALLTVQQPMPKLETVCKAWREAGDVPKPMMLKMQVSYDPDPEVASLGAFDQWKTNVFGSAMSAQLRTPIQFEQAAEHITPGDLTDHVHIGTNAAFFIEKIKAYIAMGFSRISIHNVNRNQKQFLRFFGDEVIPHIG
nr:TIGR03885 family FMN-dependent LLM class oxidoreductase [Cytophagales bacterium]